MRVLLSAPFERPGVVGGQARAGRILSEELQRSADIEFALCVQPSLLGERSRIRRVGVRLVMYFRFIARLGRFRPDVVHVFSPCSFSGILEKAALGLLAKCFGGKVVLNFRNDPEAWLSGMLPWKRKVSYAAAAVFDGYICQYAGLTKVLVEQVGADPGRIFTVHNAVVGRPRSLNAATQLQRFRQRRLAFIGNLEHRKGVDVLLRALQVLHERGCVKASVDIIGGTPNETCRPYRDALEAMCKRNGLSQFVTFHNAKVGVEKEAILEQAAILVLPSRAEGFPNVALEAFQFGVPVILSRTGAADDIKAIAQSGLRVVRPNCAEDIAFAIEGLLLDFDEYKAASHAASAATDRFRPERMAQGMIRAYKAVEASRR